MIHLYLNQYIAKINPQYIQGSSCHSCIILKEVFFLYLYNYED